MRYVVRQHGAFVIRHPDVPIFAPALARIVMNRTLRTFLQLALQYIAGQVSDEAPVGVSGHLAQSFGASPATETGGIEIRGQDVLAGEISGRVFSSLPYAIVIDQGREAGKAMPPIDAIKLWVQRVFGIPDGFDDDELEQTAWAVAISIARKGIAPRHFVRKGMANAEPGLEGIFNAMAAAFGRGLVMDDQGGSFGGSGRIVGGAGGGGLL